MFSKYFINPDKLPKDDIIFICFSGIHAREWIAPAMATYIMRELVERNATKYIDNLNIHILPSANPDGYEHSRNSDRLWRKTRSSTGSILGCKGVDGNRNWDFHFDGK